MVAQLSSFYGLYTLSIPTDIVLIANSFNANKFGMKWGCGFTTAVWRALLTTTA